MEIFGYVLVPKEEHERLTKAWHVSSRVYECHRWFSGWKDLDIIWDYLLARKYGDVGYARNEYAHARKTDVYGHKEKKATK